MAVLAFSFVRYELGATPPQEPISGRFGDWPIIEALFLGDLWGVVAVGAILFAIATRTDRPQLLRWAVRAWVVVGTPADRACYARSTCSIRLPLASSSTSLSR